MSEKETESSIVMTGETIQKAIQHESIRLFTRALIGVGLAYIAWSSNRIVGRFDATVERQEKAIAQLSRSAERLSGSVAFANKELARVESTQRDINLKLDKHISMPHIYVSDNVARKLIENRD